MEHDVRHLARSAVVMLGPVLLAGCGGSTDIGDSRQAAIPPAALIVNSVLDQVDAHPGDGACTSEEGLCTLRAAIMEANASGFNADGDRHTIVLPAGRYTLSIPNPVSTGALGVDGIPDRPATSRDDAGSLLLKVPMTLRGAGARATAIDANRLDRVFEIAQGADSTLSDLTITGGAGNTLGGGVYAQALARLERVLVTGNEASGGGGIFVNPLGTLDLVDSTVSHNFALNQAGGIRIDSRGTITNSTISHNRANGPASPLPMGTGAAPLLGKGGGVDIRGPAVTISNSTIVHNSADGGGAGIHFAYAYTDSLPDPVTDGATQRLAEVLLANTIVAGNESVAGPGDCLAEVASSQIRSLGNNLDSDGSCGLTAAGDVPQRDPLIGPLVDNGGSTDTHALRPGSSAIGAGNPSTCTAADQRGAARAGDGICDIGAYESR